jgi:hypothetical protein
MSAPRAFDKEADRLHRKLLVRGVTARQINNHGSKTALLQSNLDPVFEVLAMSGE